MTHFAAVTDQDVAELIAKSIITIAGHNNERGLDAYDSEGENHQENLSNFIANDDGSSTSASVSSSLVPASRPRFDRSQLISPDAPEIRNPTFSFFDT